METFKNHVLPEAATLEAHLLEDNQLIYASKNPNSR